MNFSDAIAIVAPFYNLALVAIAVVFFIILFRKNPKQVYLKPWKLLFAAVLIYIVEQVLSILRIQGIINYPIVLNSLMETGILFLFIYMLLLQKEYVQKRNEQKKTRRKTTKKKVRGGKKRK